jgi:hypothetical protein
MRFLLLLVCAAALSAAPRLRTPPQEEKAVAVGLRFFTLGGDELEVVRIDRDGLCQVREVRSGISSLDTKTFGREPLTRAQVVWYLENAEQKAWDE